MRTFEEVILASVGTARVLTDQRRAERRARLRTSCRVEEVKRATVRDLEFRTDAQLCSLLLGNLDGAEDAFEVSCEPRHQFNWTSGTDESGRRLRTVEVEGVLVQRASCDGDEPSCRVYGGG